MIEDEDVAASVFVYGTLLNRQLLGDIIGRIPTTYSERLRGYKKVGLNIIEDRKGIVDGVTFEVTSEELKALDTYESVSTGLYKQISVRMDDGEKATAYQLV